MVLEATVGGTRRHLLDLVQHLDRRRFRVAVAASCERDPRFRSDLQRLRAVGFACEEVPMVRLIRPWRDAVAFLRLYRHLQTHSYTIVHTHSSKAGFLGRWAAWACRIPIRIHTPHGFPFDRQIPRPLQRFYRVLEQATASVTTRLICVSCAEAASARKQKLLPDDCLVIIPNGIALPLSIPGRKEARDALDRRWGIHLDGDQLLVASVGRLVRQKGYPDFIAAASLLHQRFAEARFVLAGEGEDRVRLTDQIASLALPKICMLLDSEAIPFVYGAMDVFVCSSLWEGLPYTVLDAMAAGRPVVATRVGGLPECVRPGRNGFLVAPHDPAALADAIGRLLADPLLRERMGGESRRIVEAEFRLDQMVQATEALYEACLREGGGTG